MKTTKKITAKKATVKKATRKKGAVKKIATKETSHLKYKIFNKFHNTEMVVSVDAKKIPPFNNGNVQNDILSALDYEQYSHGDYAKYAKSIEKKIKDTLCGNGSCRCVYSVVE